MIRRDQYGRKITPNGSAPPAEPEAPSTPAPGPASEVAKKAANREPATADKPAAPVFRPVITTRVTPERPAGRLSERVATLSVVLALLAVLVAGGAWYLAHRADPHYIRARDMVADYEVGRPAESRNYSNAIYAGALTELALVDPDSVSAEPAHALQQRIERDVREFERLREERAREAQAALDAKNKRQRSVLAARQRARINPVTEYPECEHEEKGADHSH